MPKTNQIIITVELDENNIPEAMRWKSTHDNIESEVNSFFLSLWDGKEKNSAHLNLWTKDMLVDEMKQFVHQTLLNYSDTLKKAANDEKLASALYDFCHEFAIKAGILKSME